MKRALVLAGVCLAAGSLALAQEPQTKTHTETTVKHSGPGPDTKTKMESVVGTVKEYEAGKKIKISGPNDKTYTFDLDENARVTGAIAIGQKAKVQYWKDNDGHERVSVLSEASGPGAMPNAAAMPRSHTEETVKNKVPNAPDTKVKTETVVGTIKKYEPGKKIVVTGPGDKDYSFDLDENASILRPVSVGDRVKVTYQKGDTGDKVTVIAHYGAKA
jgi:hypothetical protein